VVTKKRKLRAGPELGMLPPTKIYAVCKIYNFDQTSPEYGTISAIVRDLAKGYDLSLSFRLIEVHGVGMVFDITSVECYPNRESFKYMMDNVFEMAEKNPGLVVFCLEETDKDGVIEFLLAGLPQKDKWPQVYLRALINKCPTLI
jgi:hypothetical protein